ncbi:hypothetical protein [Bacillus sp. FJAT-45350]|uniref:hypothetical protein n=1 Tax=Bacillus sp. FJAT-45350 TaxID=2011014 RepID=UPI0015C7F0A9|nr:hypothetical protein [Bacillus sp. FJAT-45350]
MDYKFLTLVLGGLGAVCLLLSGVTTNLTLFMLGLPLVVVGLAVKFRGDAASRNN